MGFDFKIVIGIVLGLRQGVSDMITTNLLFVELMPFDCIATTCHNNQNNAFYQNRIRHFNSIKTPVYFLKIGNLFAYYNIRSFYRLVESVFGMI